MIKNLISPFASSPNRRIHPQLKALLELSTIANYRIVPFGKWLGLPLGILDRFTSNFFRGALLPWTIRKCKPDILHALELQNVGYVSLRELSDHKPEGLRSIATNWGSDIFWFQGAPNHRAKFQALLNSQMPIRQSVIGMWHWQKSLDSPAKHFR